MSKYAGLVFIMWLFSLLFYIMTISTIIELHEFKDISILLMIVFTTYFNILFTKLMIEKKLN